MYRTYPEKMSEYHCAFTLQSPVLSVKSPNSYLARAMPTGVPMAKITKDLHKFILPYSNTASWEIPL